MHASTKLAKTSVQVVQYQGSLKLTMDLDLKIYVRMRRRGGSMGVRGAVLPGDFGGIRRLSGGFPGGTNREGAFVGAVNRTACSSKSLKGLVWSKVDPFLFIRSG